MAYNFTKGDSGHAEVEFNSTHQNSTDQKYGQTHTHPHDAVKVLSTVKKVLSHHADRHNEVTHYHFYSSGKEPSRVKLYKRFTDSAGGTNTPDHNEGGGYHHTISVHKL